LPTQTELTGVQSEIGSLASDFSPRGPPDDLTNLQNIRTLPKVLAAFLGLIAIAVLGAVLLSCARRRSPKFGVLSSIGMTRANIRAVLNSQGTAIGLFGLVVGFHSASLSGASAGGLSPSGNRLRKYCRSHWQLSCSSFH
jgi:ABC-type antimicrobial peptide transport system permease subunit